MIKIFQIVSSINVGGAENIAFTISENVKINHPNDFEFFVIELFPSKSAYAIEKKKELASKNITYKTLFNGNKRFSLFFAPFNLLSQIVKEKPQIVHSHTDLPDLVLSIAIRLLALIGFKTPKIVRTIHNTELWSTHKNVGKFTEKSFNNDYVVGVSDAALKAYVSLRQHSKLSISRNQQIIFNGCTIPQKNDFPFYLDTKKINIAFCGRLEYQKGIDVLIERIISFQPLLADKIMFHIIGNGTYKNEVEKLSKKVENVFVYDSISKIADKLSDFDFIIMPSRFEGLVLFSIEASLAKVPVIAANAPGLDETLPNNWPLKFNLESNDELESIFKKIINKEYELDVLKENAFTFVVDTFSLHKMVECYSQLYFNVVEKI